MWLGRLVLRALDSQLDGREFDSWPPRLVLGCASIFGCANHLGISPCHSVRPTQPATLCDREMRTGQCAEALCSIGLKAGMVDYGHPVE